MHLNPVNFSFGMQEEKLLSFMLTKRAIEENLDMCPDIIDIRSPSNVKVFQKLIVHLVSLSRFLSCARDEAFQFFTTLKKKENLIQ